MNHLRDIVMSQMISVDDQYKNRHFHDIDHITCAKQDFTNQQISTDHSHRQDCGCKKFHTADKDIVSQYRYRDKKSINPGRDSHFRVLFQKRFQNICVNLNAIHRAAFLNRHMIRVLHSRRICPHQNHAVSKHPDINRSIQHITYGNDLISAALPRIVKGKQIAVKGFGQLRFHSLLFTIFPVHRNGKEINSFSFIFNIFSGIADIAVCILQCVGKTVGRNRFQFFVGIFHHFYITGIC